MENVDENLFGRSRRAPSFPRASEDDDSGLATSSLATSAYEHSKSYFHAYSQSRVSESRVFEA
jgi:hypothetical protein